MPPKWLRVLGKVGETAAGVGAIAGVPYAGVIDSTIKAVKAERKTKPKGTPMMFKAPNAEYNMTVAAAAGFKAKLAALGIIFGDLHLNGQSAGEQAEFVPVEDAGIAAAEEVNVVARINGAWHNMAMLKKEFGGGSIEEFRRLCADCRLDADQRLLNIPGAMAAIEALIAKA